MSKPFEVICCVLQWLTRRDFLLASEGFPSSYLLHAPRKTSARIRRRGWMRIAFFIFIKYHGKVFNYSEREKQIVLNFNPLVFDLLMLWNKIIFVPEVSRQRANQLKYG